MKIINSRIHGIIDYIFILFLYASPTFFGLHERAELYTYLLGTVHLFLTLSTNYEFGLVRIILFKHHGWLELIVSFALVGVAFYLGEVESELSRNFYFGVATLVFLTWLLTEYKSDTDNDFL